MRMLKVQISLRSAKFLPLPLFFFLILQMKKLIFKQVLKFSPNHTELAFRKNDLSSRRLRTGLWVSSPRPVV